jgi:two-component system, chemotaxis family, chemotaxis protein CheY
VFDSTSRFLIVDDSEMSRQTIRAALEQLKFKHIDEAENGEVAWAKILKARERGIDYSLVFLDINMPVVDGFGFLTKCRQTPDYADLPVIMVTSESQKDAVVRAVMEGVSGYVVKPFGADDIKKKLTEISLKMRSSNNR